MRLILVAVSITFFVTTIKSQEPAPRMAEYPGGKQALYEYIRESLQYPPNASALGIEGKVNVAFVIDTTGAVTNVEVLKGISHECDAEAVRVIENIPKNFIPAQMRGRLIRFRMVIPINFSIGGTVESGFKTRFMELKSKNSSFNEYEELILDATSYLMSHSTISSSNQSDAIEIVDAIYDLNPNFTVPTQSQFHRDLEFDYPQLYYEAAMIKYILLQRLEGRDLNCSQKDTDYLSQEDVQEVQLEGAKSVLKYMSNEWNFLKPNKPVRKYVKALMRDKLTIELIQKGF